MICVTCKENNWDYRRKTNRAGRDQYGRQCLTCGGLVGTWIKRAEVYGLALVHDPVTLEPWDDDLKEDYWTQRISESRARLDADRQRWFSEHAQYLRTERWRALRRKVLERSEGLCEGCRDRAAAHVHHLSYDHWQRELLYELVALCEPCHKKAHEKGSA